MKSVTKQILLGLGLILVLGLVTELKAQTDFRPSVREMNNMLKERMGLDQYWETFYNEVTGQDQDPIIETLVCSLAVDEYTRRPTPELLDIITYQLMCYEY
jgi:hypothetical protein